jgi:polysaccharide export outer membrane protein
MFQQKICFSLIVWLVLCLLPVWAAAETAGAAIEMNNGSTVKPPPATAAPAATRDAAAQLSVDAAPTAAGSWWDRFSEMVGLKDSDPGLTGRPLTSQEAQPAKDYIIGPGDVIGISVWRDENLTKTVVVLPDGKITFPLIGDLVAGGKTVAQLKKEIETGLARFTADTGVTVEVKQSNSMIIYIIGRVNSPGRQLLVANTNVLQALVMVGGPNPYAKKSSIRIFRQEDGKTNMFLFNYDEVAEGRHLEMNIDLKRGDVIIVP